MYPASRILRTAAFAACAALDRVVPARGVPVLLYHSIDASGSPISTSAQNFAWQMSYLARRGYTTMTLDELLAAMEAGHMPARRCIITFDDGFRNLLTEALPILATFGFIATVYVATEYVGRTNSFVTSKMPEFPMLSWEDIGSLRTAGWQVESHGHTHTNLPTLEPSEVSWELQVSRDWLSTHANVQSRHFCYPRGKVTPDVVRRVQDADYRSAASLRVGLVRSGANPWLLPRLPVNDRVGRLHFKALISEPYSWFASGRRAATGRY